MAEVLKVVHLIPYDGVGGVEAAARSLPSGHYSGLLFQKLYLAKHEYAAHDRFDCSAPYRSENDLRNYIYSLKWLHFEQPKLLIASLWRSYFVLIVHKLLHPRCHVVCFLHSNRAVHWLDRVLAWLAMAVSREIWTDSRATLSLRVCEQWHAKSRVISFVLQRFQPVSAEKVVPCFMFWGRLALEKNLGLSLRLIALLRQVLPDVRFLIIGPDRGQRLHLEQLVQALDLLPNVAFMGVQTHEGISQLAAKASFYLQTSHFEGMAVSVMEAMQLGLVPVVTPVGEIAGYCEGENNALFVNTSELESTVVRLAGLMRDQKRYDAIRNNAIDSWASASLYSDDILAACRNIL